MSLWNVLKISLKKKLSFDWRYHVNCFCENKIKFVWNLAVGIHKALKAKSFPSQPPRESAPAVSCPIEIGC